MRFEITHENGEKEIKEFRGEKAVVGSGDNVDIFIPGEHVAKNHIIIEKIDGKIYVTDLDNENGTYVNDELLEPHKKIEFLSFFPVQIGPKIFIHLLAEEEQKVEAAVSSKPAVEFDFTPPPPKKTAPKKAAAAPSETSSKKVPARGAVSKPANNNAQNQMALVLLLLSVGLGFFANQMSKEDLTPEIIAELKDPQITLQNEQHQEFSNFYEKNLNVEKCRDDIEKLFCSFFTHPLQKNEGYLIENGVLYLYLNLDRSLSAGLRDSYSSIPSGVHFQYFLVNTILNYNFLTLLEEYKISHLNFILFNVVEGKVTLTKYFSNSVDLLLKNVALDDVRTALAEAQGKDSTHLQDLIQPHIDWINFK